MSSCQATNATTRSAIAPYLRTIARQRDPHAREARVARRAQASPRTASEASARTDERQRHCTDQRQHHSTDERQNNRTDSRQCLFHSKVLRQISVDHRERFV
jgi:hypothetical protein